MALYASQTKVIIPARRPDILTRQRLLEQLYELLDYKLIIVAAPAGYGKTSLLVDFADNSELPVCWLSVDAFDRDPHRFLSQFTAAIAHRFPDFDLNITTFLESSQQSRLDMERVVSVMVNDIYESIREHFLIILDDYHLVNDSNDITQFVNRFVQEVGVNCHILLSSRTLISLPDLPLMVARMMVSGLSYEELAFQPGEIQDLALQNYRQTISTQTATELARETEGWITGLLLSSHSKWQGITDRLRIARVSGVGLYEYLAQQVLDQQPDEIRDFLLYTSIFDEFDLDLCKAVFGARLDSQRLMSIILHNNLFVLPLGEDGRWLRYHHLFRDFLRVRMEQEHPQEINEILNTTAEVYLRRSDWEKAYEVYRRLENIPAIVQLIDRIGSILMRNGRMSTLAEWIDTLPDDVLAMNPRLLSLRGGVSIMQGQVEGALNRLNQAEGLQRDPVDANALAVTLIRKATAYRFLGNYSASYENALEAFALAESQEQEGAVRAEALRMIGMSLFHIGKLDEAIEKLNQSRAIYQSINETQSIALVLMELGMLSRTAGRYREAMANYQEALSHWQRQHNIQGQANLLNNLGVLHHLMGEYDEAASVYEKALHDARQSGYLRMEAYILCGIGDLYNDLAASDAANEAYRQAEQIAQNIDEKFLLYYVEIMAASGYRKLGEFNQAQVLLDRLEPLVVNNCSLYERGLWYQESGRLNLSQGNAKQSREFLYQARECFEKSGQRVDAVRCGIYLASAIRQTGEIDGAFHELENVLDEASGIDCQHLLVVAGRDEKYLLLQASKQAGLEDKVNPLIARINLFEENVLLLRRNLRKQISSVLYTIPKFVIRSFGRTQIEVDGSPVNSSEWHNQRRVREIFFTLLAYPEGLSRDQIAAMLWPDSRPDQLRIQFKNTLYRLRLALGQDVISHKDDRYLIHRGLDYEYDVELFLKALHQAERSQRIEDRISAYQKAIDLYKGAFLVDLNLDWITVERTKYHQLYFEALLKIARICLEIDETHSAITYCQLLLNQEPCQEEAHRIAMRAYAARGDRAAVSRQFDVCRNSLLKEIHVTPSLETEQLYKLLMK